MSKYYRMIKFVKVINAVKDTNKTQVCLSPLQYIRWKKRHFIILF